MDWQHRLELIFIELMSEMGIEDDDGIDAFYDRVTDVLKDAIEDYKEDAGWEEDDEDD